MHRPLAWRAAALLAVGACVLLYALPLVVALAVAAQRAADPQGWADLMADPQLPGAWRASIVTALASTLLSTLLALALAAACHGRPAWRRLGQRVGPLLAVPHAAFAIGFAWLIAPAGLVARLLAPWVGADGPPDWPTTHDRWGLGLVAVLVLKETPFLLWSAHALLTRPDVDAQVRRQLALGRTLGHAPAALWWRVLWPAWAPRLAGPVLAVLAYGLTVVDVALVIGPTAPPTLAPLAHADLLDGDPRRQAQGAAAAGLLALTMLALAMVGAGVVAALRALARRQAVSGRRSAKGARAAMAVLGASGPAGLATYAAVIGVLVLLSVAGPYPYPSLQPQAWNADAWRGVATAQVADLPLGLAGFSVALSAGVAALALALAAAWLAATPAQADRLALPLLLLPLLVPQLLLAAGLYPLSLRLRLDGSVAGLVLAHLVVTLPYVLLALQPAWRSHDPRWRVTALALGRSRWAWAWRVHVPMLAVPLAAAYAVGFAVSHAQYLVTQFVGAGRLVTVTTEAVTLATGGQRGIAAAWALVQALAPALVFVGAQAGARRVGRVVP